MGKTFSTGLLTNGVFQDASNNIGIGAAPSGTYKLEVTGTAKVSSTLLVSGAATFSSSVSTGGALNITVPYSAGTMTILTQDNLGNGIYLAPRSNLNFDYGVANNTTGIINNFGYQNGSAHFRSLGIGDGKGGTIAFFDGVNSRVGIGTTDPLSKSHTVGSSTAVNNSGIMQLSTGTAFSSNKLIFGINDGSYAWIQAIHPDVAYRNLVLQSGGGNLLIGTTTNGGQKLQVNGTLYASSVISSGTSIAASTYVSAPFGFYTTSNNNAIPFTTWTTLTTVEGNTMAMYLVVIGLAAGGLTDWSATGILYSNGTTASWIVGPTNGSLVQLRISGTSIQVFQNGGSPSQNLYYKLLKIA